MHVKNIGGIALLIALMFVFILPAMAQDATEEPVEPATTEEAMEATATEEAVEPAATEEAATPIEETEDEAVVPVQPVTTNTILACPPGSSPSTPYTIRAGDTLFSIARQFEDVTAFCIAEFNRITNPSLIYWGLTINIPTPEEEPGTGGPDEGQETPEPDLTTYTVRAGDNLYRISLRFDTTMARLQALNPDISNINVIYAGQELVVPDTN